MSFILDALKKLEREKQAREPGVVMVGPVPWGGRDRRRGARTLVLAAAALGVVAMGALWWLRAEPSPAPPPPVDRDAATDQRSEPLPVEALAPGETTHPRAGEAVVARPSASHDRREGTAAPPSSAPAPRELELPPANPATAPAAPSETAAPEEITTAIAETAPEPPVGPLELPVEAGLEPVPEAGPAPAEPTAAEAEFRLTAISTRDGEPIALLNDRLVREGDSFGGVRVLRIGPTDVEIEVDGERRKIGF